MSLGAFAPGRRSRWLAWLTLAGIEMAAVGVRAGMVDKEGMAEWEICGLCHGADGISAMPKFPKLAGQKPDYLVRQFRHFRRGQRTNDGGQMQAITTEVTPAAVEAVAAYFSQQPPPSLSNDAGDASRASPELHERGRKLFYEGTGAAPACASCHADPDSEAPWIDAQHRDYVEKQLNDFHAGRRADSERRMTEIAAQLTERDRAAVALFVSTIRLNRQ